jgi:cyclopropane-fatty-acyl-phospholipid synthase
VTGTLPTATTTADPPAAPGDGVAPRLAAALRPLLRGDLPVRLVAWDGSAAGPPDAPRVELRSADAVRRLLRHPGELGAAQAYVTGAIELPPGDCAAVDTALTHAWAVARERGLTGLRPTPATLAALGRALRGVLGAADLGVGDLARPPAAPVTQARLGGRLHSPRRDRRAISFHYDLSNEFYALLLDPSMAYSCGYWTSDDPAYGVAEAQRDKLDLVCRKLGLEPGTRMLDVGCGWGSLSLHAAEHFGARVTGVTIAAEQKHFIDERIAERGLGDRVEIRLQDYREVPERDHFDAVGSLEMGEHVGEDRYPTYARVLHDAVRPGGRVLVQQMSRPGERGGRHPGGGPFIESFIAPDMHMRPVGETVAFLEEAGLELRDVHALREHYVRTVQGWIERFEEHEDQLVDLVGEEVVRVWRLYLVGGSMTFRDGRMGVDQLLLVRPGAPHTLPPVRAW